jgi:hypothetical protein
MLILAKDMCLIVADSNFKRNWIVCINTQNFSNLKRNQIKCINLTAYQNFAKACASNNKAAFVSLIKSNISDQTIIFS